MDSEQRAIRAKQLQDDPIFREVMDGLRAEAIDVWSKTKIADSDQRDFSWMMVRVIDRIGTKLQAIVDDHHISLHAVVRAPD